MPYDISEEDFDVPKSKERYEISEADFGEPLSPPPTKPYGRIRSFATLPPAAPQMQPGEFSMLPIEEQRRIAEQQLDIPPKEIPDPSMLGAMAREAGVSVIPTLAGAGGFAAGGILGEPLGPVGVLGGGVAGSMLAGGAASDIQKSAAEAIAPEAAERFYESLEAGRQKYPIASTIARLAAAAPFFSVSAPRTAGELIKRGAVGAGISAIPAVTEGRLPTPAEAAEAAAFGALYGDPRAKILRTTIPTKGIPDALHRTTTETVRNLREQPGESVLEVPVEVRVEEAPARSIEQTKEEVQGQGRALDDITRKAGDISERQEKGKEEAIRQAVVPEPGAAGAAPGIPPLRPAVVVNGKAEIGEAGQDAHNDIKRKLTEQVDADKSLSDDQKIEARYDILDGEHVFVDPSGKVLTREEAGSIYDQVKGNKPGTTQRLHSQDLVDLPAAPVSPVDSIKSYIDAGKDLSQDKATEMGLGIRGNADSIEKLQSLHDQYADVSSKKTGTFSERAKAQKQKQFAREALEAAKGEGGPIAKELAAKKAQELPTAKATEGVSPASAEAAPAPLQSAMAVGIAPPGTELAQKGIAKGSRILQGIRTLFKSNPTRKLIDQTFDAADNKANISGQQAGRSLRIGTNRLEREAAMAIVEANGDINKLNDFEAKVAGKDDRALAAVRYARQNWNRLQPLSNRVSNLLDSQLAEENANGINTDFHEGYVPHIYDQDLLMGKGRPYVLGGAGGKGIGTGFKKGRTFDTVFDAIEAGYKPKSIDVADLVEHRVKSGNRLVNRKAWGEALKQVTDPSDGNPIVTDIRANNTAPGGYSVKEIIPGVRVAWHNGYSSLFDALTGTSRISGSLPGQIALNIAGGIKHGLLVFDTFHASRMLQKELFLTGKLGYNKGKTLLEYADQDLNRAVKENEITPEMADWVRQNRATANLLLDSGLNVGRVQEALYNSIVRQIPVLGHFNKWVFEKLTRGAMMESGLIEFERVKKAMPELSDKEVARKVSRDLNAYFGNLGRQGIFKSRQMQDIANLVALAPQWVESMARTEAYGAAQAAKGLTIDPILHKTILTGTMGKAVAQGLAAYLVGTQLLNLFTRGKPTWDNQEEGHKLDAWIPDVTGKGPGFFISPFSVVAELTHDMLRYSHKEGTPLKAAAKIASNKASPIWRAGKVLITGKDYDNKKIDDTWGRVKRSALALAPTPIPLQSALKTDYPGQTQRQITASLGFKTEPAESATQQIMAKSDEFLKKIGKPKPTIEQQADIPSYNELRNRLRVGDTKGAKEEIANLLKTRNRKQVGQAMRQGMTHPFTGSKADEGKFRRTLSPEDLKLYDKAKEERRKEYQKFLEVWRQ